MCQVGKPNVVSRCSINFCRVTGMVSREHGGLVGSQVGCLRVLFLLYELPGIRVGL